MRGHGEVGITGPLQGSIPGSSPGGSTGGSESPTAIRSLSLPLSSVKIRLTTGEHLPVVVDDRGIPVDIFVRFMLSVRLSGQASKTLETTARRLAELPATFAEVFGESLLSKLRRGDFDQDELAELITKERRRARGAGDYSPTLHNQRVTVWTAFLEWAALRTGWVRGYEYREVKRRARDDNMRSDRISDGRDELYEPPPEPRRRTSRKGFLPEEVRAIRAVVHVPRDQWGSVDIIDLRDYCIFILLRHAGLRRGEVLNIRVRDLPAQSQLDPAVVQVVTDVMGESLKLNVPRLQDDPLDERRDEPSTKRWSRSVPMPFAAFEALHAYADREGLDSDDYLIRSTTGTRGPLSVSSVGERVRRFLDAAADAFEKAHPGSESTLRAPFDNNSHRFRHTLAVEHAEELYKSGADKSEAAEELQEIFGWSGMRSAGPYLKGFFLRSAEKKRREHLEDPI